MAQTTGRTLDLLALLQTGRTWSRPVLCARLAVSPRTLRRDVDRLRELGYGVQAAPGPAGGYRLGPGESVPPLVLTDDEAMAIAVGLRVGAGEALGGLGDAAASALVKLEHSLGSRTRERLTTVGGAVLPLETDRLGLGSEADLGAVADVIRQRRRLTLAYTSQDGTETRRVVEPHRLVHASGRWYLVAYDVDRAGWRTLRLDRLTPRPPWGRRFEPRTIPDDRVQGLVAHSVTTAPYRYRCRVRFHAPLAELRGRFGPLAARLTELGPSRTLLTAGSNSLSEVAGYLATAGCDFTVLDDGDGPALRAALRETAARLTRAAAGP